MTHCFNKQKRYQLFMSIKLILLMLFVANSSFAQDSIEQDILETVNNIENTLGQAQESLTDLPDMANNVTDNNERLANIQQLLESAFLEIGNRFDEVETRLDELQAKQLPPHLAKRWVSPEWHAGYRPPWGVYSYIYILNPGAGIARVDIRWYRPDGSVMQMPSTFTIDPYSRSRRVFRVKKPFMNHKYGWVEVVADTPVLVSGSIKDSNVVFDAESRIAYQMTWYPMPPKENVDDDL